MIGLGTINGERWYLVFQLQNIWKFHLEFSLLMRRERKKQGSYVRCAQRWETITPYVTVVSYLLNSNILNLARSSN